jgi:hypothetical protein
MIGESDDMSLGVSDDTSSEDIKELFSIIDDDDDFILPVDEEDTDPKELDFNDNR